MKSTKHSGFTLIEVLVALAIFTVGILAVVTIGSQSQLLSKTSSVRTRAALLAQEGIESAIAAGYGGLTAGEDFINESSLSYLGDQFNGYQRVVHVDYVNENIQVSDTDHGMKLISSTVTWDATSGDESKNEKTFTATTILANL